MAESGGKMLLTNHPLHLEIGLQICRAHWFLGVAAIPFIYYLIVIYSSWRYFRAARRPVGRLAVVYPPVSILKPMRGQDPGAYENFASFCRQDYPEYEILLCVDPDDRAVMPLVERLRRDFPERTIRVLYGSGRDRHQRQSGQAGAPGERGPARSSGDQRQRRAGAAGLSAASYGAAGAVRTWGR